VALDSGTLTQLSEKMKARQQSNSGGLSQKQLTWLLDGYNLGLLNAEECKTRFGQLIDDLEQGKSEQ